MRKYKDVAIEQLIMNKLTEVVNGCAVLDSPPVRLYSGAITLECCVISILGMEDGECQRGGDWNNTIINYS